MAYCPFCTQGLPPDSRWCPHCKRAIATDIFEAAAARAPRPASADTADPPAGHGADAIGVYTIESPVPCPNCRKPMKTVRVLRLTRTQVPFTSTLPRGGRAIVCPDCSHMLSVELAGLP
jgi:hypothetical protein